MIGTEYILRPLVIKWVEGTSVPSWSLWFSETCRFGGLGVTCCERRTGEGCEDVKA